MIVSPNMTAVDISIGLSGSLAGLYATLETLPVGTTVGWMVPPSGYRFPDDAETKPRLWEDVNDIGQTWTPELEGKDITFSLPMYKQSATEKAPYFTDKALIKPAIDWGNLMLQNVEIQLSTINNEVQPLSMEIKNLVSLSAQDGSIIRQETLNSGDLFVLHGQAGNTVGVPLSAVRAAVAQQSGESLQEVALSPDTTLNLDGSSTTVQKYQRTFLGVTPEVEMEENDFDYGYVGQDGLGYVHTIVATGVKNVKLLRSKAAIPSMPSNVYEPKMDTYTNNFTIVQGDGNLEFLSNMGGGIQYLITIQYEK